MSEEKQTIPKRIYVSGFPILLKGYNGYYIYDAKDECFYREQKYYMGMEIRPTLIRMNKLGNWEFVVDDNWGGVHCRSNTLIGNWKDGVFVAKEFDINCLFSSFRIC